MKNNKLVKVLFYTLFILMLLIPFLITVYAGCVLYVCFVTMPFFIVYLVLIISIFSALRYWIWKKTLPKKTFFLIVILPILSINLWIPAADIEYQISKIQQNQLNQKLANIHHLKTTSENIIYDGSEYGFTFSVPQRLFSIKERYTAYPDHSEDVSAYITADSLSEVTSIEIESYISHSKGNNIAERFELASYKYKELIGGKEAYVNDGVNYQGPPGDESNPQFQMVYKNIYLITPTRNIKVVIQYRPLQQTIAEREIASFIKEFKIID